MEIQRFIRRTALAVAASAVIVLGGASAAMAVPALADGSSVIDPGQGAAVITVKGVAAEGAETGCRILTAENSTVYLLLGGEDIPYDTKVQVTGEIKDVATTCQQGTPLKVISWTAL